MKRRSRRSIDADAGRECFGNSPSLLAQRGGMRGKCDDHATLVLTVPAAGYEAVSFHALEQGVRDVL